MRGGFDAPKTKGAATLVGWEPRWPCCGLGLGGPKRKEAPVPMRRGPH